MALSIAGLNKRVGERLAAACYGVGPLRSAKWFCRRCEPHSLLRSSKVKCHFCPVREGALKPSNDANEYGASVAAPPLAFAYIYGRSCAVWAHVVCALLLPKLGFVDPATRATVNVKEFVPCPAVRASRHMSRSRNSIFAHPGGYWYWFGLPQTCYMCVEMGKIPDSTVGSCVQCQHPGCNRRFHAMW